MTADVSWIALPQPSDLALREGRWRPRRVQVIAADPALLAEARRFACELTAGGWVTSAETTDAQTTDAEADGADSIVRLHRGPAGESAESFTMIVGDDIEITADAPVGAFRATRQLLHNLRAHDDVPHAVVRSAPAVAERGLHLDAARKHFSAEWIAQLLRDIADIGINVLQWHVSENEGFRIGSAAHPEIVSDEHVTREQALALADLARSLHIDLIPSLDLPGHLEHVLAQHPEHRMPPGGALSERALDITDSHAVDFALSLIDDLIPLFLHSTHWHLGGDEFVDFADIDAYPSLREAARERFGPAASGFDLLTEFVNLAAAHVRARGFSPRVWNDGMLRGSATTLAPDIVLTWWTNWHAAMRPLAEAVRAGHALVNFNDALLYHVLGENAGYVYPTSERIWAADWHPGLFPSLPGGARQELAAPYPPQLRGASFSIWCDRPEAQSVDEVRTTIRGPLCAMAERAWNGGSMLTHEQFAAIEERLAGYVDRAAAR